MTGQVTTNESGGKQRGEQ